MGGIVPNRCLEVVPITESFAVSRTHTGTQEGRDAEYGSNPQFAGPALRLASYCCRTRSCAQAREWVSPWPSFRTLVRRVRSAALAA